MALTRTSNFASHPRRPGRPGRPGRDVAAVVWLVVLVLGAATLWSWGETRTLRADAASLAGHADRLRGEIAVLSDLAAEAPSAEAIAAQAAQIGNSNDLAGPRAAPPGTVLTLPEAELPAGVWLAQLTYSAETGRLSLSLQGTEETALPPALRRLAAAGALRSAKPERQIRLRQDGRNLVQYDIEAVAQ